MNYMYLYTSAAIAVSVMMVSRTVVAAVCSGG